MKKPNLFIVGAPKCGTTSLAYWLSQHPEIYLTDPKEPNYFSHDLAKSWQRTLNEYEMLFNQTGTETVIAEASTRYLYSKVAIEQALNYNPDAKFIALVRNPVEMFFSLHNHLYETGIEPERSAEIAWNLQWERSQDDNFYQRNPDPDSLKYAKICQLGEQIGRLFNIVPKTQRKVLILDDIARNPEEIFLDILEFLCLKPITIDFETKNKRFRVRSMFLKKLVRAAANIKRQYGVRINFGLLNTLSRVNRRPTENMQHSDEFEAYLKEFFSEDVNKLCCLLGKDLSTWIKVLEQE